MRSSWSNRSNGSRASGHRLPLPDAETQLERDLFDALTIMFVAPRHAERARNAITAAVGEMSFEILTAFLAFVRTAHYLDGDASDARL